jgi:hypothetical protein
VVRFMKTHAEVQQEWEALKRAFLDRIDSLDQDTTWQATADDWYLEMMRVQAFVANSSKEPK